MYRLLKILSIPLVVALLVTSVPIQALTNNAPALQQNDDKIATPTSREAEIIGEDKAKREKNVKHFMKDDLSFEAAVYPVAVHYNENGVWKDIDNSLTNSLDESSNQVLENKENSFKVNFSKKSNSKKLVSIKKDGYKLTWNLVGAQKTDTSIDIPEDNVSELSEKDKKLSLDKLSSSVTYKGILTDIDLQYIEWAMD